MEILIHWGPPAPFKLQMPNQFLKGGNFEFPRPAELFIFIIREGDFINHWVRLASSLADKPETGIPNYSLPSPGLRRAALDMHSYR